MSDPVKPSDLHVGDVVEYTYDDGSRLTCTITAMDVEDGGARFGSEPWQGCWYYDADATCLEIRVLKK